ncbi:MAG: LSM domain-containing protein [Candidatus Aenigmatarchaeota archaeon]
MDKTLFKLLNNYRDKRIKVRTRDGNLYEGILKDFSESWHEGVGNLVLKEVYDSFKVYYREVIIRGTEVCIIVFE